MKCPKCGGSIMWDDTYDSFTSDEVHLEYCRGHCDKCDQDYKWIEEYIYSRQIDLEEVSGC
jgi:hypothetical protein